MSEPNTADRKRLRETAYVLASVVVATPFVISGAAKLFGMGSMVDVFGHLGLGQWVRYLTGGVELAGALLLLRHRTALVGALILSCVANGAIVTHVAIIGGSFVPAAVLATASAGLAYAAWHRQLVEQGEIA
jgi:uncharacterized membrane protein YphA (DoxX/SURF4 family)